MSPDVVPLTLMALGAILGTGAFCIVLYFIRQAIGFTPHAPSTASQAPSQARPFLDGLVIALALAVVVTAIIAPVLATI